MQSGYLDDNQWVDLVKVLHSSELISSKNLADDIKRVADAMYMSKVHSRISHRYFQIGDQDKGNAALEKSFEADDTTSK